MSASTALSRITGFARTWVTAVALGVTPLAASYHVANNLPNMIYELVAGGIVSSLFIPIFLERMEQDSEEDAWRYASYLFNLVALTLGVIAIAATIWAPAVVRTQTFRIDPEEAALAVFFFRIFAIQVVFYGAGSVIAGLLNARRKFLWPALGPVFNNVVVILTMVAYIPLVAIDPRTAMIVLAAGTSLGVFVMFAVQVPSLVKLGVRYTPRIDLSHPGLRAMGRMAIPTAIYVVTNLVAVSFRNAYAFEAAAEGPATLMYAWMFYQLPYGVLAVALATAIFTELSEASGRGDTDAFRSQFARGFRVNAMLILPAAALLVSLSTPLVTMYRAGRFTAEDIPMVSEVLMWWGVALFFFAAYMYVLKTFYSLKDTKTPMIANLGLTAVQVALYASLTSGVGGFPGLGLIGIPITDAVFFALSLIVLSAILYRKIGGYDASGILSVSVRIALGSVAGAAVAWFAHQLIANPDSSPVLAVAQVVLGGGVGLAAAWGIAAALRVPEVSTAGRMLRGAFARFGGGR